MPKEFIISKSRFLDGLKCPKLFWTDFHAKETIPPPDETTQAIFRQGNDVTELARTLFPGGVLVEGWEDYDAMLKKTRELVAERKTIFEGAFRYQNTFARPDVLVPNKDDSWDLYEVKSSTGVDETHLQDVAFQRYCYEGCGLKIRKTFLTYVNNEYIRDGEIEAKELLASQDITAGARDLLPSIPEELARMTRILEEKECPKVKIGMQCKNPYECPLKEACWKFLPEENVFLLNRIAKKKAFALIDSGVLDVKAVPATSIKSLSHRIVQKSHSERKTHKDATAIRDFLGELEFPLHFLDFESVGYAIPYYNQSRPYQQVAFQFSLHILPGWGKPTEHFFFLADGAQDPRPQLLERLKTSIRDTGSILAFNMSFERARLEESVEVYPEYKKWFHGVEKRLVDLMDPFRKFDYYDPKQMGKYSIKNVYPALTGGSYKGLGIEEGGTASREFARVTFGKGVPAEDCARVRKDLEIYCKLDTQAMIDVLDVLRKSVSEQKNKRGEG